MIGEAPASRMSVESNLCTECGLCCDGVLFADVELRRGDKQQSLRSEGISLLPATKSKRVRLAQPCAALCNLRCQVYENRPSMCRGFECSLLIRVKRGELEFAKALKQIRSARRRHARLEILLEKLGNHSSKRPLAVRFRSCMRALENRQPTRAEASLMVDLTAEMHRFNLALQREFVP